MDRKFSHFSPSIAPGAAPLGCANGKRGQALGGDKNHAVVMPDADVPKEVSALMGAAYGSCGERCMAIPLMVAIGDATADAVVAGLKSEIAKMKVGPGVDARSIQVPGHEEGYFLGACLFVQLIGKPGPASSKTSARHADYTWRRKLNSSPMASITICTRGR